VIKVFGQKNGFEKKMAKKKEILARKGKQKVPEGIPVLPPVRLDDPVDVDLTLNLAQPHIHIPIKDRLGSIAGNRKRKVVEVSLEDEKEEGEEEDEDYRDHRRNRTEREDSPESTQRYSGKRPRGSLHSSAYHEDRANSRLPVGDEEEGGRPRRWNGYEGGMVADAEEEVSRQRSRRREYDDRGRGSWRDGPGRKPSVKDRLGW